MIPITRFLLFQLFITLNHCGAALRICHHNDFHAHYAGVNKHNSPCTEKDFTTGACFGSISRIKAAMDCDVKVHSGDFVEGTVYDSVFGVDIAIDMYNSVGYDISVLGNHEFNNGPMPVLETIRRTPKTTWLTSNIDFDFGEETESNIRVSRALSKFGLCWVGVLTEDTKVTSKPGRTVSFRNVEKSVRDAIDLCNSTDSRGGVIALTHIGYDKDVALCSSVPDISFVIGGHSHTDVGAGGFYPTKITRFDRSVCYVLHAHAYGRRLGVFDILPSSSSDPKRTEALQLDAYAYVTIDNNHIPSDPEIDKLMESYTKQLEESIDRVVGFVSAPVDADSCRKTECAMGNLVCEALLQHAKNAQVCVMQGGGLRASFDSGDVTIRKILSVLPFSNVHATFRISGHALIAALEYGLEAAVRSGIGGKFPQIGGIRIDVDFAGATRPKVVKALLSKRKGDQGEEQAEVIENERMYTIVTNDFLARGGEGYEWTDFVDVQASGIPLDSLLSEYLKNNSPYNPIVDGRINATSG